MSSFTYRAMGAAVLDSAAYEDVEQDRTATRQALVIVFLSSLAAGIGVAGPEGPTIRTIGLFTTIALVTWLAWAAVILHVGGRMFPEPQTRVSYGQLIRTIGFSAAPGVMQVMALLTSIRAYVFAVAWLWMVVAMIVAVRQALDYTGLWRAAVVSLIALAIVAATVMFLVLSLTRIVS